MFSPRVRYFLLCPFPIASPVADKVNRWVFSKKRNVGKKCLFLNATQYNILNAVFLQIYNKNETLIIIKT